MARPTKLNDERQTRIREAILAGADLETAARRGGIGPTALYEWKAKGIAALAAADGNIDRVPDDQRAVAVFAEIVEAAVRDWEMGQIALVMRAARGTPGDADQAPWERTTTTTIDADGRPVTTTVERRGARGDWRAAFTLLERRYPQRWGKTLRTEVTGADGGPIEVADPAALAETGRMLVDELAERRDAKAGPVAEAADG